MSVSHHDGFLVDMVNNGFYLINKHVTRIRIQYVMRIRIQHVMRI